MSLLKNLKQQLSSSKSKEKDIIAERNSQHQAAEPKTPPSPMEEESEQPRTPPEQFRNSTTVPQITTPIPLPKKVKYHLSDFTLQKTLGTGSFGRVHLAKLKTGGKFYAMKVLKKADIVRLKQVEHTCNEKNILEQLNFPFLVSTLGTFQDTCNLYIVMEFVSGGELFSYLRRSGRFPNLVTRFYTVEVFMAFEYLHLKDIIYRDLKPENLLLDNQGCFR